jgi:hypothetical protein
MAFPAREPPAHSVLIAELNYASRRLKLDGLDRPPMRFCCLSNVSRNGQQPLDLLSL